MSFEEYLEANLPRVSSFHPHFNEALAWVLRAGGKHFRAKLVLGVAGAFNPLAVSQALPVALAVEMLHTYSLIHDDLPAMDNASLRRGVETLHIKYDEVTAILVGDALNTAAFGAIARAPLEPSVAIECVGILAKNGGLDGMVIGQAMDCFFENSPLSLDELKFLHLHKTGALIAASMELGAVIAGAGEREKIYNIGLKLGLAFQIHDDIIDATATSKSAGKPTRSDSSKNSFTNLLGIQGAREARDSLEREIVKELENSPIKTLILELINRYLKDR